MHIAGPEDEHIFTVRLWRERSATRPSNEKWRGRLRHAQSKSSWNFVGLAMVLELMQKVLERGDKDSSTP